MGEPVIEAENLSFSVGGKEILKGLSFAVEEGEYLSVVGPNGAGKTTLLKCLDRIHRGAGGVVRIAGRPLGAYRQRELARLIGYVPQSDGQQTPYTVYEFVLMGRYPYMSPFTSIRRRDDEAVRRALELTGCAGKAERVLSTLSGGERRKVFIAAALAQGARILLLDEPTAFLDPRHQDEVHALLRSLHRENGATIVSVTHDVNEAAMASQRILALRGGEAVFHGSAGELMRNGVLRSIYDKEFIFVEHPETGAPVVVPGGGAV